MLNRILRAFILVAVGASSAAAQTIDGGVTMPKRMLSAGVLYAHDSWDQYWEGGLKAHGLRVATYTLTFAQPMELPRRRLD